MSDQGAAFTGGDGAKDHARAIADARAWIDKTLRPDLEPIRQTVAEKRAAADEMRLRMALGQPPPRRA